MKSTNRSPEQVFNWAVIAAVVIYAIVRAVVGRGLQLQRSVPTSFSDVLLFAVLAGLLSYGTLETLKRLTPARALLQSRVAWQFLGGSALKELVARLGGTDHGVPDMFDLPTEQLAAQITFAVDGALADLGSLEFAPPGLLEEDLLMFVAQYSPLTAVLAQRGVPFRGTFRRPTIDSEYRSRRRQGREDYRGAELELSRAARVGTDQLQIALTSRWQRLVRGAAVWTSGLWGIGLVEAAHVGSSFAPSYLLAAVLVGGPLSWTFRDIAAAFEQIRT